jgi:hypothetical protein
MRIRRLVKDIDEQHREAMRTIEDDLGELHFGARTAEVEASRRRFVRNLGVGGVVAVGAAAVPTIALASTAAAQTSSSGTAVLPTSDVVILDFAVGLELAAESAYGLAINTKLFDAEQEDLARTFGRQHHEHAIALATLVGRDADNIGFPNPKIVDSLSPQLTNGGSADAVLQVLFDIEQGAAATYLQAVGNLTSSDASGPAGSILPIESQHAVAIGSMLELPIDQWMPPFQTTAAAFDPARYSG